MEITFAVIGTVENSEYFADILTVEMNSMFLKGYKISITQLNKMAQK